MIAITAVDDRHRPCGSRRRRRPPKSSGRHSSTAAATTPSPPPPSTAVDNASINCRRLHPTAASVDNHCLRRWPSPTNTPLTAASVDEEDGHRPPTPSTAAAAVNDNDGQHQRRLPPPSTKDVIATATSFDVDVNGGGKDATYRRLLSTARTAIDLRRHRPPPQPQPQPTMTMAIGAARRRHRPKTSLPPVERRYIQFVSPPCPPRIPPVFPHLYALFWQ